MKAIKKRIRVHRKYFAPEGGYPLGYHWSFEYFDQLTEDEYTSDVGFFNPIEPRGTTLRKELSRTFKLFCSSIAQLKKDKNSIDTNNHWDVSLMYFPGDIVRVDGDTLIFDPNDNQKQFCLGHHDKSSGWRKHLSSTRK